MIANKYMYSKNSNKGFQNTKITQLCSIELYQFVLCIFKTSSIKSNTCSLPYQVVFIKQWSYRHSFL